MPNGGFVADGLVFFAAQDSRPRDRALSAPRHCFAGDPTILSLDPRVEGSRGITSGLVQQV